MVIQRWVLEKMYENGHTAPFEELYNEDGTFDYGDDMAFCLKCRELDIDVYAHFDYIGSHFKTVDLMWVADLVAYAAQTGRTNFTDEEARKR